MITKEQARKITNRAIVKKTTVKIEMIKNIKYMIAETTKSAKTRMGYNEDYILQNFVIVCSPSVAKVLPKNINGFSVIARKDAEEIYFLDISHKGQSTDFGKTWINAKQLWGEDDCYFCKDKELLLYDKIHNILLKESNLFMCQKHYSQAKLSMVNFLNNKKEALETKFYIKLRYQNYRHNMLKSAYVEGCNDY